MARRQKKQPKSELEGLLERAQAGDRSTLPAIREMFDLEPGLWEANGDLARIAEDKLIDTATGDNLFFKEVLRRRVDQLKSELVGSNPSPLERLLADRVAACWLQVHYWDTIYSQALGSDNFSWKASEYYQRRLDQVQRRYLAAIRSLAQVRRLLGITVQVNIADQQVNVVG